MTARFFPRTCIPIALATTQRGTIGGLTITSSLPVATSLRATPCFALLASPVPAISPALPPAGRRRYAVRTAVTAKRMGRPINPVAPFEKTDTWAKTTRCILIISRFVTTLGRWAQGSCCSQKVKSRLAKRQLRWRGAFLNSHDQLRATTTFYLNCPKPRFSNRGNHPASPTFWPSQNRHRQFMG
jgi:hypothetical protein